MPLTFTAKKMKNKGFGLVEVILSLGVAMVIVVALVSLSIYTLRSATQSQMLMEGTRMANQELEQVRVLRDRMISTHSWSTFYDAMIACTSKDCSAADACHIDNSFNLIQTGAQTLGDHTVCFWVSEPDSTAKEALDVITTATWSIGGVGKSANNYTRFTNWQK